MLLSITLSVFALSAIFVSGILYGFSDFIMRGLNSLSPKSATRAMQSINVTVYKSLFMVMFMILAVGSLIIAIWSVVVYDWQDSAMTILGSALYIFGMFMVTGRGNVPLNEALRNADSSVRDIDAVWSNYYRKWTRLNTLRCIFGVLAGICWLISSYMLRGMS